MEHRCEGFEIPGLYACEVNVDKNDIWTLVVEQDNGEYFSSTCTIIKFCPFCGVELSKVE